MKGKKLSITLHSKGPNLKFKNQHLACQAIKIMQRTSFLIMCRMNLSPNGKFSMISKRKNRLPRDEHCEEECKVVQNAPRQKVLYFHSLIGT